MALDAQIVVKLPESRGRINERRLELNLDDQTGEGPAVSRVVGRSCDLLFQFSPIRPKLWGRFGRGQRSFHTHHAPFSHAAFSRTETLSLLERHREPGSSCHASQGYWWCSQW